MRVLGIYDLSKSHTPLGDLLILLEELKILSIQNQLSECDLAIVVGKDSPDLKLPPAADWLPLERDVDTVHSPILSTVLQMEPVRTCILFENMDRVKAFLDQSSNEYVACPGPPGSKIEQHRYGSFRFIQSFFEENNFIPQLSCSEKLLRRASEFLSRHVQDALPFALHLRNSAGPSGKPGPYDAQFPEWIRFLSRANGSRVKFLLIGSDHVPSEIAGLPNVIVTRTRGSDLALDLALIQQSHAFMGLASGPCTMAMLSSKPYAVYKNPSHHPAEMERELGESGKFNFASNEQRFLREVETADSLFGEFERLCSAQVSEPIRSE